MVNSPFGPPRAVSPTIRAFRWTALISGVLYARSKMVVYTQRAEVDRAEAERKRVVYEKYMKSERRRIQKEEAQMVRDMESGKLFEPNYGMDDDEN